jgi:macrolide transport system ATP-binding/permease protein
MNAVTRFIKKLALLFQRHRLSADLDEEMAFHCEQATSELIAGGMTPDAARYAATRQFGNATRAKEKSREVVGFRFETIIQDLRFAIRQLRKNPGFAATAILILALGIASSVAIFAFVDAALIKPLPYKDSPRLAVLYESIPIGPKFHLSYPDYVDWKRENKVFSLLNVYDNDGFMQKTSEGLRKADGARVSDGFFKTLGVSPVIGRDFYYGEDKPNPQRTTLLSYSAWRKRYGGNPNVLGQTVVLDDNSYVIIGVLPRDFSFAPAEPADFWTILKQTGYCETHRGCHNLFGIARLKDGVSFATAFADIKTIAQRLEKQYPDSNRDQWANMLPLTDVIVGDIRPILIVLLSGAGLLLLIASVNVASLLLVRSESRRREMAVRGALGASPKRLARQFVTEGLLLAAIGGALGLAGAVEAMRLLDTLMPKDMLASMPYLQGLGLNGHVSVFACVLAALSGCLFALTPMSRLKFAHISEGLSQGGRGAAGIVWRRFGVNLVVIELATAMVLLAGAGLLGKSFYRLLHTDIGIQPDHIATVRVDGGSGKYDKDEQRVALEREIVRRVQSLPGVISIGITTKLPIEDGDNTTGFRIVGRPYHGEHNEVAIRSVSASYMPTLQTRLISGRYFSDDEDLSKPRVVIVNQALAKQYFPGEDPVGKQIAFDETEKSRMLIVGVVSDLQEGQLDAAPRGAMYRPFNQSPFSSDFAVVVRTAQDETSILPSVSATIHQIDPEMAIYDPITLGQKIHDAPSTYLHRSSAWLVGWFAAMALLLGVVGLYGVIAYSVSQRTREIGVRMALGAQRSSVYSLILREAGRLIVVGVIFGLLGSVGAAMLMRKLLFGVPPWDAPTLVVVAIVLAASALLASYIPARRAASVSPVEALRVE